MQIYNWIRTLVMVINDAENNANRAINRIVETISATKET